MYITLCLNRIPSVPYLYRVLEQYLFCLEGFLLTLQDLLDSKSAVTDSEDNSSLYYDIHILSQDFKSFYEYPDFNIQVESILAQMDDNLFNRSYAVYDFDFNFVGIFCREIDGYYCFKRNAYSIFVFLLYGFTKREISSILHISYSYLYSSMSIVKEYCSPLLDFLPDFGINYNPNVVVY